MNDILLRLTDGDLEYLMLYASIGIAASEEFNEIDDEVWGSKPEYRQGAQEIIKELEQVIAYDLLMRFIGDT
jgi:hypothetical protein